MTQIFLFAFLSACLGGMFLKGGNLTGPVAILTDFESKPSEVSVAEMKKEVLHLMKNAGIEIDWRELAKRPAAELEGISMRFRGKCRASGGAEAEISDLAPYGETLVLASTKVSQGRVLPSTEVGCDQIRKCLGGEGGINRLQREKVLGRAMGRVVAHELFHILLDTKKHSAKGVAKAVQDNHQLSSRDEGFTPHDLESLGSSGYMRGSSAFVP